MARNFLQRAFKRLRESPYAFGPVEVAAENKGTAQLSGGDRGLDIELVWARSAGAYSAADGSFVLIQPKQCSIRLNSEFAEEIEPNFCCGVSQSAPQLWLRTKVPEHPIPEPASRNGSSSFLDFTKRLFRRLLRRKPHRVHAREPAHGT